MRDSSVFRRVGTPAWRRHLTAWLGAASLVFVSAPASSVVTVSEPWVRLDRGTQQAEAYMEIRSSEGGALVRFAAPAAQSVTLLPAGKAAVPLPRLALPPGQLVRLAPGGTRFVLQGLPALKLGERVPLKLWIEEGTGLVYALDITAEVRVRSPTDDERRAHRH